MTEDEITFAIEQSVSAINDLKGALEKLWTGKIVRAYGERDMLVKSVEIDLRYPGNSIRLRGDVLNKDGSFSRRHSPVSVALSLAAAADWQQAAE